MGFRQSVIKKDGDVVRVRDLKIASFLVANGLRVTGMNWESKFCFFHFENSKEFDDLVNEYKFGKAMIETKKLYAAQDELKSLLYNSEEKK